MSTPAPYTPSQAIRLGLMLSWLAGHSAVSIESAKTDVDKIVHKLADLLKSINTQQDDNK